MPSLICFDLGNVLVRLKAHARFESEPQKKEYQRLTQLYGLGALESTVFFTALEHLFEWTWSLSDIESWFVHQRIEGLHPGAAALLGQLHDKGYTLALLSNINACHWAYLERFGVFKLCDFRLLSFEQHCAKPDVPFYTRLERLNVFAGAQIIFFDDLAQNIEAARRLGWVTCQVSPDTAIDEIRAFLLKRDVL